MTKIKYCCSGEHMSDNDNDTAKAVKESLPHNTQKYFKNALQIIKNLSKCAIVDLFVSTNLEKNFNCKSTLNGSLLEN